MFGVEQLEAAALPVRWADGTPALCDRIVRRAYEAGSPEEALSCVAGELSAYAAHQWAWVARFDAPHRSAELGVSWPGNGLWRVLPRRVPVGAELVDAAVNSESGLYFTGAGAMDPYDEALRCFGAESHVTVGLDGPSGADGFVTFAFPSTMAWSPEDIAFWRRVGPSVRAALSVSGECLQRAFGRARRGYCDPAELERPSR